RDFHVTGVQTCALPICEFEFDIDDPRTWGLNAAQTRLAGGGMDNRLYLEVPFEEKDEARAFGARWDPKKKLWWIHTDRYQGGIRSEERRVGKEWRYGGR